MSQELWDDVASKCDYATFFHTYTWAKIITDTYENYKIATKAFIFSDGIKVIFPLIEIDSSLKGVVKSYQSMFPGVYGGIIANDKIEQSKIDKIFCSLKRVNIENISIIGNPLFKYNISDVFICKNDFTQIFDLEKGYKCLWDNFQHSCQKQIKKGIKYKFMIKIAEELEEVREYYSIYEANLDKWGKTKAQSYPFELFKNIFMLGPKKASLWLIKTDNNTVGGTLVFYTNHHSVEWHACFLSEYFKHGARNLLVSEIIKYSCQQGYKYYDFNPSGGYEGVVKFKDTFNPRKVNISRFNWENKYIKFFNKMRDLKFATSTAH